MLAGQVNFFLLVILAIQQRHIAGALHECSATARTEFRNDVVATLPVTDFDADLDEFVMIEADIELGNDCVREAGVAHHDYRLEGVAQAAQVLFL